MSAAQLGRKGRRKANPNRRPKKKRQAGWGSLILAAIRGRGAERRTLLGRRGCLALNALEEEGGGRGDGDSSVSCKGKKSSGAGKDLDAMEGGRVPLGEGGGYPTACKESLCLINLNEGKKETAISTPAIIKRERHNKMIYFYLRICLRFYIVKKRG